MRMDVWPEGGKIWKACIAGPWYYDSNPMGVGKDREKAIDAAIERLKKMKDEIDRFLEEWPSKRIELIREE